MSTVISTLHHLKCSPQDTAGSLSLTWQWHISPCDSITQRSEIVEPGVTAVSVTWLITLQQVTWPSFSHSLKTKIITLCWIWAFWSNGSYSFGHCKQQLWVLASLCACGSHMSSLWFITWVRLQQVLSVRSCLPSQGFTQGFRKWDSVWASPTYGVVPKLFRWLAFLLKGQEMKMNAIQIFELMICSLTGCYPNSNSKICVLTWSMPSKILKTNLISSWKKNQTCCRAQLSIQISTRLLSVFKLDSLTLVISIS